MFGNQLPETVYIEPMEYGHRRLAGAKPDGNMQCVWIGLAAIAIVYLMNEQNRVNRHLPVLQPMQTVAGMVTGVVRGVSAKIAMGMGKMPLIDACKVFPQMKCGMVSLIDNTSDLSNPKTPTPEDVKRKNSEALLKFVNDPTNERACITIFAHWCPHCHSLINEMVAKANSIADNGVKYLLVNGESVHGDAFHGENAIVELEHYPTILCKIGTMGKEVNSLDEATRLALETPLPAQVAEESSSESTPPMEAEEAVEDPLAMLF